VEVARATKRRHLGDRHGVRRRATCTTTTSTQLKDPINETDEARGARRDAFGPPTSVATLEDPEEEKGS
jgi:hypothetical protein